MESKKLKIDHLLWGIGLVLIALGLGGYYYFSAGSLLLRVLGLLGVLGLSIFILFQTQKGKDIVAQWFEALEEVRKMVWPTRKETMHTTFAVLGMLVVMGLLLWTADFLLLRAVAWLTGQWGV